MSENHSRQGTGTSRGRLLGRVHQPRRARRQRPVRRPAGGFRWGTMPLVFPLFLITVVTEIPMLRLLYKKLPLSWPRACALGIGINIASYAVVLRPETARCCAL